MRRCPAFTLVETILAASILLLAGLLVVDLLPSSWLAVRGAEQRLVAGNLAQSLLEEQRAIPVRDLVPRTRLLRVGAMDYTATLEVAPAAGSPRLRALTARASWSTRRGRQEVVRTTTVCEIPQ